jgi:hypothetical protein
MAVLNHRLDHKLNTLRRLRRLHKTIALYLAYVFYLGPAWIVLLFFYQQSLMANRSLVITILVSVMPPLIYCLMMFDFYDRQLNKGQELKENLYESFMKDEVNSSNVIKYHNQLEQINW